MQSKALEERRALCDARITLDGKPAIITGVRLPFALVRQTPEGANVEWSWDAVARIVAAGGAFRS